ncbi:MAG: endo alpha-1,4 polygalactosaminidase [Anaerolineae bacterium]
MMFYKRIVILALSMALTIMALLLATGSNTLASPVVGAVAAQRADGAQRLYMPVAPKSAQNPAWSPDGQSLVFTLYYSGYDGGRAGIYRLPTSTRSPVKALDEAGQQAVSLPGAAWNATTNRLVFSSDRQATDEIWTSAPNGSGLARVTTHSSNSYYVEPSWSPDGQWIVFEVDNNANPQQGSIWKVRVDGTGLTMLTSGPDGGTSDMEPNWSPSGDRIVFQRSQIGSDSWNLYTMSPDGSNVQEITASGGDTDASWSPDGRWIVYSSDQGTLPVPNLFVVPSTGGAPVRVTTNSASTDSAPSWSPDGRWIAFASHPGIGAKPAALWRIAAPLLSGNTPTPAASATRTPTLYATATATATRTVTPGATQTATATHTATPSATQTATATRTATPSATQTATATITATASPTATPGGVWRPPLNTSWQWQLDGTMDTSFNVNMYDIDLFDNTAGTVAALHAQGHKVICYISAGTFENWRPDAGQFPASVIGNPDQGWGGEYWLDIRRIDVLGPIMRARMDLCKQKGFDGLEPDNIDGYSNSTGFPLSYADQIAYNTFLANEAHARGLSIGLKNDLEQVTDLLPLYNWQLVEDCYAQSECSGLKPFIAAGKASFDAEYTDTGVQPSQFCPVLNAMNANVIFKHRNLDAWRQACR